MFETSWRVRMFGTYTTKGKIIYNKPYNIYWKKKNIDFPDFTGRRLYNGKKKILPAHDRTGRASVLRYHLAPEK